MSIQLTNIKDYLVNCPAILVNDLRADSRLVDENDVFVATKGQVLDGRLYIEQAISKGASVIIYENIDGFVFNDPKVLSFGVTNLSEKLPQLASAFYDHPSKKIKVIGVTGTNGKSSTTYYIAQFFELLNIRCGIVGTVGTGFIDKLESSMNTTPGPIEIQQILKNMYEQGASYVAMEVSSHGIVQHRIDGITFYRKAFTNLSRDHLDFHKTMENYFEVKKDFILDHSSEITVVNSDDQWIADRLLTTIKTNIWTVGKDGKFSITNIEPTSSGTKFCLSFEDQIYKLNLTLIGEFNVYNISMALALVLSANDSIDNIEKLIHLAEKIKPLIGRMEIFKTNNFPMCVVDYAHTPDGLEKALSSLRSHTKSQVICVVGCGGDRDKGKRSIMAQIATSLSDKVIFTDDNPRTEDPIAIMNDILVGAKGNFEVIHDRKQAIEHAINNACENDIVLVAGKGHEDYQIIGTKKIHFSDQEIIKEFEGI